MLNLFNYLKKYHIRRVRNFKGGINYPDQKTESSSKPIRSLKLSNQFILPIKQYIENEGEICVSIGDKVLRGQALTVGDDFTVPLHAPTSGIITKIDSHIIAHPSISSEECIFLTPDGKDQWINKQPLNNYRNVNRIKIIRHINQAGIIGLGGAGFPTGIKLFNALCKKSVNTLIINAAECEPHITADDRLIREYASEVLCGCRILAWIVNAEHILIGIEDNKPEAIYALKNALSNTTDNIQIRILSSKYPSGSSKQLIKVLTGKEIPHGEHSIDIGVLIQNVGTAYAIKRAIINGEPLTERIITVTGKSIRYPGNIWGRFGTPISHVLNDLNYVPRKNQLVIIGGALMGFTITSLEVPIVKITNCIFAPSDHEIHHKKREKACIRCGRCAEVCPVALLPQQLYWYSRGNDHKKVLEYNLKDCIECGACAWVCPSNIPLVQYYRQEKAKIKSIDAEKNRIKLATLRFEARQLRLKYEKDSLFFKNKEYKLAVAEAIERVKSQKLK